MTPTEKIKVWRASHLDDLHLLRATFVTYAFKRHMHDYFVIGMVEEGLQRFDYGRDRYYTPPTGLIVINPGEAHTGEPATENGFRYRAFYPEAETMQRIAEEVKGRSQPVPFFPEPVIHDAALFEAVQRMHVRLEAGAGALEQESLYLWVLAQMVVRHAGSRIGAGRIAAEPAEVRRIREYLEEHYAEDIRLADLAGLVHWSPFYLLRVFRRSTGLPPHAYLETIRVREAERMLRLQHPLVAVAYATGFSSQSHFTTTFKRLIGATPGQYAKMHQR